MNALHLLLAVFLVPVLILPLVAAFTSCRHPLLGVLTTIPALFAVLGGWHAHAESGSLPWTIGYGVFALVAGIASFRHFTAPKGRSKPAGQLPT